MGAKEEKQKTRLLSVPSDYTFTEAKALLYRLGFELRNKGKTSGSRVLFYRSNDSMKILLHKPHPGDEMSQAAVRQLKQQLLDSGDLYE